jgi:poly(3-hydroxybutyrate) depolymerase
MRFILLVAALTAAAAELPPAGKITDDVKCVVEPGQSYAVYVPSGYSPDRLWPVILAFDPAARGRIPVERYQAAAELYGYIVAGSNQSRNGSWATSEAAVRAMSRDVAERFTVNDRRVYTAGMSGGARVALAIAISSLRIAGAIASSAGFPDSKPRKSVGFVVFGTAGTEDFNYTEMRQMDRELTSPHRLRIFQGGHVWLSPEVAMEAVEWLELQAMKSGRAARDEGKIERIFAKRAVSAQGSDKDAYVALKEIAADFEGLKDVSEQAARAAALGRDKRVTEALKQERREEEQESRLVGDLMAAEARLASPAERLGAMQELRDRWNGSRCGRPRMARRRARNGGLRGGSRGLCWRARMRGRAIRNTGSC